MSELTKQQRAALDAVARRFSATWEEWHRARPGAWLTREGKPVAVEIAAIARGKGLPSD